VRERWSAEVAQSVHVRIGGVHVRGWRGRGTREAERAPGASDYRRGACVCSGGRRSPEGVAVVCMWCGTSEELYKLHFRANNEWYNSDGINEC
jgi:hypothetical protein